MITQFSFDRKTVHADMNLAFVRKTVSPLKSQDNKVILLKLEGKSNTSLFIYIDPDEAKELVEKLKFIIEEKIR